MLIPPAILDQIRDEWEFVIDPDVRGKCYLPPPLLTFMLSSIPSISRCNYWTNPQSARTLTLFIGQRRCYPMLSKGPSTVREFPANCAAVLDPAFRTLPGFCVGASSPCQPHQQPYRYANPDRRNPRCAARIQRGPGKQTRRSRSTMV